MSLSFEKSDRPPSKISNESAVWLPEDDEEPLVTKISHSEVTIDGLDIFDFFEALEQNPHPSILAPIDYAGEVGECLQERYPYLQLATVDRSKQIIIEALESDKIDLAHIVEFMAQLSDAAGHIHNLGFVHRDLRPRNIFMDSRSDRLTPIIIDYGLVCRPFFNLRRFGSWNQETPPEAGKEPAMLDSRYDVFQLGYMLRALTHEFSHSYNQWLAIKPVDRELEDIIGCAVGPLEQRYPDGETLADELNNYLRLIAVDVAAQEEVTPGF